MKDSTKDNIKMLVGFSIPLIMLLLIVKAHPCEKKEILDTKVFKEWKIKQDLNFKVCTTD